MASPRAAYCLVERSASPLPQERSVVGILVLPAIPALPSSHPHLQEHLPSLGLPASGLRGPSSQPRLTNPPP